MAKETYADLKAQIEALQEKAEAIRAQEAEEVLARIREAIVVYGFTAADLFGPTRRPEAAKSVKPAATKRRSKRRAKGKISKLNGKAHPAAIDKAQRGVAYSDGNGQVWHGFGRRPGWVMDALAAGKSMDQLRA